VNKLKSIPLKYQIGVLVLLLIYVIIINTEHQMGSQRYYVTAAINPEPASKQESTNKSGPTEAKALQCVGKKEAIDLEIKFERMAGLQNVEREKMHVFSKWIICGVL
jgi:hypothetical protein